MNKNDIPALNRPLCMQFANELIDMVRRVKENRDKQHRDSEDVNYFMHKGGVGKLLEKIQDGFRIYIGISVGQYYHEGAHARAQIACLQNIREAYELWLQDEVTPHANQAAKTKRRCKVKHNWPVELIVADCIQALNSIPGVELDMNSPEGQCAKMLLTNNAEIKTQEDFHVKNGMRVEEHYRELLSYERQSHQKDVVVNLSLESGTIRWVKLKRYYNDPLFMEMVNYLESCFKYGVHCIKLEGGNSGYQGDIANDNFLNYVKVNDLSYVVVEIVMVYYKIFNNKTFSGVSEQPFLIYPGAINLMSGTAKNILSARFRSSVSESACVCIQSEEIPKEGQKRVSDTQLFSSTIVTPDSNIMAQRIKFIRNHIGKVAPIIIAESLNSPDGYKIYADSKLKRSVIRSNAVKLKFIDCDLRSDEFEYLTKQLLITAHESYSDRFNNILSYESKIDSQRRLLMKRAYEQPNLSALSVIFCLSLSEDSWVEHVESFIKPCQNSDDIKVVRLAYSEIETQIRSSFVYSVLGTLSDDSDHYDRKYWHAEQLHSYLEHSERGISILLIAARLESLHEVDKAVIAYAYLLNNNFLPLAQLANLMRIGVSSAEALYQIGKFIIKTKFKDDSFYQSLVRYAKIAINEHKHHLLVTLCSSLPDIAHNFSQFYVNQNPTWTEIALICIELAIYNGRVVCIEAAKYLSRLFMVSNQIFPEADPKRACTAIEYAYRHTDVRGRGKLMGQLSAFYRDNPEDLKINALLANFCTRSLLSKIEAKEVYLEDLNKPYRHIKFVYTAIGSTEIGIHGQERKLIIRLRRDAYNLSLYMSKLENACADRPKTRAKLQSRAMKLMSVSSQLDDCLAHWVLARLAIKSLINYISIDQLQTVKAHYERALEAAMAELNMRRFNKILLDYEKFISIHGGTLNQGRLDQYRSRFEDMGQNLRSLDQFTKVRDAPFYSFFYGNVEKKQLYELSLKSPLAVSLLWSLNELFNFENHPESLMTLLECRGLLKKTNPDFIEDFITFLMDYFILAMKAAGSRVFFACLQEGIRTTPKFEGGTRRRLSYLTNFYISVLDNNLQACVEPITHFGDDCIMAFKALKERHLLGPGTYHNLRALFGRQLENQPGDEYSSYSK